MNRQTSDTRTNNTRGATGNLKAIITGAGGLLGAELRRQLPNAAAYDHQALDAADEGMVWKALTNRKAEIVFHCVAMSNVDQCELAPAMARRANAVAARTVAATCAAVGIHMVSISSDYVFDGKAGQTLMEESLPRPLSVYGRTKLEGERAVQQVNPAAAIVRTSWLYGQGKTTFTDSMIDRVAGGERLSIARDQTSCPTWVRDLAEALVKLAGRRASGIFHLAGEGQTSRDEWARAAVRFAGLDGDQIESIDHFSAVARRPRFSALTNTRARALGIVLPPWQASLETYVRATRDIMPDQVA